MANVAIRSQRAFIVEDANTGPRPHAIPLDAIGGRMRVVSQDRDRPWIRSANCHMLGAVPRAALSIVLYAIVYSGFCLLLDAGGHRPSFGALTEHHYRLQAVVLLPASLLLWWLHGAVAHGLARALGGGGTLRHTVAAIGPAIALPMLLLLVVPELITYLVFGFEALGKVVRYLAPLALFARLAFGVRAVRSAHSISRARALLAEVTALAVEGIATVPWLR